MASSAIAAKLKEEGNALFVKKEYGLAIAKYSEAIAADGDNAVLYANRAACQLALHQ
jgi:stress-induced-phosphoprotein 1